MDPTTAAGIGVLVSKLALFAFLVHAQRRASRAARAARAARVARAAAPAPEPIPAPVGRAA